MASPSPRILELRFNVCSNDGPCRYYRFRDTDGIKTGQITVLKHPLFDADEDVVGHVNTFCFVSDGPGGKTNWLCTYVHTLNATATTEHGTVVTTGNWDSGRPFAVTGGTGAYVNVRGYAQLGNQGRYTLHLIP